MKLKERLMLAYLNGQQEARQQWARMSVKQVLLAVVLVFGAQAAMAAGGFEADITKAATTIQNAIYAVVGVLAAIALLITFAWGYFGKKHITDVLEVCMWIIGAGASIAGATWLFDIGKGIKF